MSLIDLHPALIKEVLDGKRDTLSIRTKDGWSEWKVSIDGRRARLWFPGIENSEVGPHHRRSREFIFSAPERQQAIIFANCLQYEAEIRKGKIKRGKMPPPSFFSDKDKERKK